MITSNKNDTNFFVSEDKQIESLSDISCLVSGIVSYSKKVRNIVIAMKTNVLTNSAIHDPEKLIRYNASGFAYVGAFNDHVMAAFDIEKKHFVFLKSARDVNFYLHTSVLELPISYMEDKYENKLDQLVSEYVFENKYSEEELIEKLTKKLIPFLKRNIVSDQNKTLAAFQNKRFFLKPKKYNRSVDSNNIEVPIRYLPEDIITFKKFASELSLNNLKKLLSDYHKLNETQQNRYELLYNEILLLIFKKNIIPKLHFGSLIVSDMSDKIIKVWHNESFNDRNFDILLNRSNYLFNKYNIKLNEEDWSILISEIIRFDDDSNINSLTDSDYEYIYKKLSKILPERFLNSVISITSFGNASGKFKIISNNSEKNILYIINTETFIRLYEEYGPEYVSKFNFLTKSSVLKNIYDHEDALNFLFDRILDKTILNSGEIFIERFGSEIDNIEDIIKATNARMLSLTQEEEKDLFDSKKYNQVINLS